MAFPSITRRTAILLTTLIVLAGAVLYLIRYAGPALLEKELRESAGGLEQRYGMEISWAGVSYRAPEELVFTELHLRRKGFHLQIPRSRLRLNLPALLGLGSGEPLLRTVAVDSAELAHEAVSGAAAGADTKGASARPALPGLPEEAAEGTEPREESTALLRRRPQIPLRRIMDLAEAAAVSPYLPEELLLEGHVRYVREHGRASILPTPLSLRFRPLAEEKRLEVEAEGGLEASLSIDYGGRHGQTSRNLAGHLKAAGLSRDQLVRLFPRLQEHIIAGEFLMDAEFLIAGQEKVHLSGTMTAEGLGAAHPIIGPEALSGIDASYRFSCTYDEQAPLPPPKVLGKDTPTNPSTVAAQQDFSAEESEVLHGEIRFSEGELEVEGVELELRPALRGLYARSGEIPPGESPRVDLSIRLPQTELSHAVAALPRELIGPFAGIELGGTLAWDFLLEVPLDRIADMNWLSETQLDSFRVRKIPAGLDVFRLDDEFCYTPAGSDENTLPPLRIPRTDPVSMEWIRSHIEPPEEVLRDLRHRRERSPEPPEPVDTGYTESAFGPCSGRRYDPQYRYVPLGRMAPHLPLAVLTAEDGDFFYHDGINWHTLRYAVERNLRAGRIETGGSTITMQLVKNLFLTKNQSLRRKLHEAALVFLIEHYAQISKARLLEIYLNIADFGPGIRGVEEACRYYFATAPAELEPVESVWLASILPAPRRYHRYFEAGEPSEGWWIRMRSYIELMRERERLSAEQYRRAMQRQRLFNKRSRR